ncbi:exonuclease domain-containing protein [Paracoccus homiensis]|uniref:exonuclease domain-containing protein n=1 Tax=Paracoccus homiensis TaxID=364199 RepID=UPI00398D0B09
MLTRLSLRLRVLLIFAGLAGAGAVLLVLALLVIGADSSDPQALDALVQGGLIAGFGGLAAVTLVWFLFDRHVARPIEALAGGLRTGQAPDPDDTRYLADLGPAARDAAEARARAAEALAEAVAEHAAELTREKATLEDILSDFGAGAVMVDPQGRVVFYNASAARLLPGLALDRPLDRHLLPGALQAAVARLNAGVDATDLTCLTHDGTRLSGRMRKLDQGTLLILRDHAPNRPAPRQALESLRRHAATLVPMLDALDGPMPPDLTRAIRDEGQGLSLATRHLTEILQSDAITSRASLPELLTGLPISGELPRLSVICEAQAMNALLSLLVDRLGRTGHPPRLRIMPQDSAEAHLRIEWQGAPLAVAQLDHWLDQAPDPEQPDQSGADILQRHGTGIWPEADDKGCALILPLGLASGDVTGGGLTYDFALASRGAASSRLSDLTCVVFDTETTGLSPTEDRIVQIAGVRIARGRLTGESFETLVNPGRPIPPRATQIHHIDDRMVADAPDLTAALTAFHHFAEDAILIAHNAPFDMGLLRAAAAETGAHFDNRVLDTVLLSAMVWGGSVPHTLDALGERLDIQIPPEDRHTAMGDTLATAKAFLRLIPALSAKGIERFEDVQSNARRFRRMIEDANPHQSSISGASGSRGTAGD